jgi:hypothetical protein
MAQFIPLLDFLAALPHGQSSVTLSFSRVEQILGKPLPITARAACPRESRDLDR